MNIRVYIYIRATQTERRKNKREAGKVLVLKNNANSATGKAATNSAAPEPILIRFYLRNFRVEHSLPVFPIDK